jgi:hypothetical protein
LGGGGATSGRGGGATAARRAAVFFPSTEIPAQIPAQPDTDCRKKCCRPQPHGRQEIASGARDKGVHPGPVAFPTQRKPAALPSGNSPAGLPRNPLPEKSLTDNELCARHGGRPASGTSRALSHPGLPEQALPRGKEDEKFLGHVPGDGLLHPDLCLPRVGGLPPPLVGWVLPRLATGNSPSCPAGRPPGVRPFQLARVTPVISRPANGHGRPGGARPALALTRDGKGHFTRRRALRRDTSSGPPPRRGPRRKNSREEPVTTGEGRGYAGQEGPEAAAAGRARVRRGAR